MRLKIVSSIALRSSSSSCMALEAEEEPGIFTGDSARVVEGGDGERRGRFRLSLDLEVDEVVAEFVAGFASKVARDWS